jgi:purine-binding chemotaxis protein CheW
MTWLKQPEMDTTMQIQATTAGDAVQSGDQYLTFMLGGEEYGIEILDVQEIKNWGPITPLPRSEKHMLGVINLRGAIVPVLDLRVRFGLPDPSYDSTTSVVIVRCNGSSGPRIVGLVVDCVSEVYHLDPGDIQETSGLIATEKDTYIRGFGQIDEKTVILLDLEPVIATSLDLDEAPGVDEVAA